MKQAYGCTQQIPEQLRKTLGGQIIKNTEPNTFFQENIICKDQQDRLLEISYWKLEIGNGN